MPTCIIKVYGNSVLTLFRPMEFSIKFDIVKSVDGLLYTLMGCRLYSSNNVIFLSLKINFFLANSSNTDK